VDEDAHIEDTEETDEGEAVIAIRTRTSRSIQTRTYQSIRTRTYRGER
jgi:hypothetical protein